MFYFIATVLLNVIVSVILKLFKQYNIDTLQAITVNYLVCVVTGCIYTGLIPFNLDTVHSDWFPWTILMGIAFISIFNLIAYCTKVSGMAATVIASKLSLVIPVIFSLLLYREQAGTLKIVGIVLAFPAVYLTTRTPSNSKLPSVIALPIVLFLLSGGLDTLVNFIQKSFLQSSAAQASCTIVCFAVAGTTGLLITLPKLVAGKTSIKAKNVVAGICLGIPNFFSIFFLVKSLHSSVFQSSATIPLLNISVLVASSVAAIVFFRESAGKQRIIGLVLALIAILLIGFGDR